MYYGSFKEGVERMEQEQKTNTDSQHVKQPVHTPIQRKRRRKRGGCGCSKKKKQT